MLYGKFNACGIDVGYSRMSAENDYKRIAVNYQVNDYVFDGKKVDLFNVTNSERLVVYNDEEKNLSVKVYDLFGKLLSEKEDGQKVIAMTVLSGGYVTIERK